MTTDNTNHASGFLSNSNRLIKSTEPSLRLRIACLLAAIIANDAILSALGWENLGKYIFPSIFLGSIISYANRNKRNWTIKIGITLFMLWQILWDLPQNVSQHLETPLSPLIKLLLLLHAGHCFDMPKRRDLNYSLLAGFAMLAITSAVAPDFDLAIYIIIYGLLFIYVKRIDNAPWKGQNSNLIILGSKQKHYFARSFSTSILIIVSAYIASMLFMLIAPEDTIKHFNNHHFQYFYDEESWIPDCPERIDWGITNTSDIFPHNEQDDIKVYSYVNLDSRHTPSNKIVLFIYSSAPVRYCRGLSYSQYDGHHWNVNQNKPAMLKKEDKTIIKHGKALPLFTVTASLSKFRSRPNSWCIMRDGDSPVFTIISRIPIDQIYITRKYFKNYLFAPLQPTEIAYPGDEIYIDSADNLLLPGNMKNNLVYEVTGDYITIEYSEENSDKILSQNPYEDSDADVSYDSLINNIDETAYEYDEPNYEPSLDEFLQLPDTVTSRTYKLAKALTAGKNDNYFKAEALARYLRKTCRYELVPPAYPEDKDTADWFIFEAKVGNCMHFATALTVLCRAANVPARYVSGYALNDYNPNRNIFYIREKDAHGWTEIFSPELGWINIDATPPADDNIQNKEKEKTPSPSPTPKAKDNNQKPSQAPQDQDHKDASDYLEKISRTFENTKVFLKTHQAEILQQLLFILAAAELLIIMRRKLAKSRREKRYNLITFAAERLMQKISKFFSITSNADNKDYISRLYAETMYILSRKGFVRPPSQTPRSFADDNESLSSCQALKNLTAMLEEEQYGNVATNDSRINQAEQYLQDIQTFCRSLKPAAHSRLKTNAGTDDAIAEKDNVTHNSQKEIND